MRLPRLHTVLPAVAISLALAAPAEAAPTACRHVDARPGEASKKTLARSTICLLNERRAHHGIRRLHMNRRLSRAARAHTLDMVRRNYFSHTSRSGGNVVQRLARAGYMRGARRWFIGENLAWGSGGRSTPREIVRAWMASPGHRHNILQSRFREIGIGLALAAPSGSRSSAVTFTTTFGVRN